MASSQFQTNIPHRPKFTISRLGNSKAQLALQKILHTILTVPATKPAAENPHERSPAKSAGVSEAATEKEKAAFEVDDPRRRRRLMGLLVEAARSVSGRTNANDEQMGKSKAAAASERENDGDVNVKGRRNKRSDSEGFSGGEMEPVVRSKRGRTRVLPCKYRDSVVEPLTRVSRNRATPVPGKRRFK